MNVPALEKSTAPVSARLNLLKEKLADPARAPVNTYRLQLNKNFTFKDAEATISYFSDLGVTHCYTSSCLTAPPGSLHGYDICDYNQINPELGGEEGYENFIKRLFEHRMGHFLDFVPNHMGIDSSRNLWWQDVLGNGRCSPYSDFFDIDWNPAKSELNGKILLPILGEQYGIVLERGELQLGMKDGSLFLRYYDHLLPIKPLSVPLVLEHNMDRLQEKVSGEDAHMREFKSIITALKHLPWGTDLSPDRVEERIRERDVACERLSRLMNESSVIRHHIEENLKAFNGTPSERESFDLLHDLLEQQYYRLSYWRTAAHEINYRRFFDINHLAGLRVERDEVFDLTHSLILRLIGEGKISGLRLDHIDGLLNPRDYFEKLQNAAFFEYARHNPSLSELDPEVLKEAVQHWRRKEIAKDPRGILARPLFLMTEKILTGPETLPDSWAVHGTSGYDFLNDVNALFVNPANENQFTKIYYRFSGTSDSFPEIVYQCKKLIMQTSMASELNVLARSLNRLSEENRRHRDFTLNSLREALREVVACFPIYRTYIDPKGCVSKDRETVEKSIIRARWRNPAMESTIFKFLQDTLLPNSKESSFSSPGSDHYPFIMKLQQFTGPVQAKGLEDTAFYRYNRLLSLNEVGGQPQRFGLSPSAFHARNQRRQKHWPLSMTTTATHDHKRGEDVRARLNVLSEIPDEWRKAVRRWSIINRSKRRQVGDQIAPDRNDEYLLYQTLIGMWPPQPLDRIDLPELTQRLTAYMQKAAKEAKIHTSWINPNAEYDQALEQFIRAILTLSKTNRFPESFTLFQERVARMGVVNSLSQVLLKIASPGIPDLYQGTELWDLSLVDPDNRRAVDFDHRKRILGEIKTLLDGNPAPEKKREALEDLLNHWQDGRIKMFITACGLRFRREHPEMFLEGDYLPLQVEGDKANHIVAFARQAGRKACIAVAPRLAAALMEPDLGWPLGNTAWKDTRIFLPPTMAGPDKLTDVFTGTGADLSSEGKSVAVPLDAVLSTLPLALLTNV